MIRLAFAALLFALPAAAEPIKVHADTATFTWTAATGPVVGYEAKLLYLDGTESTPVFVELPPTTVRPRKGIPFRFQVRGCRRGGSVVVPADGQSYEPSDPTADPIICDGPWSEPSIGTRLCILQSDVDCDGTVGGKDYILLSGDWGQRVETAEEVPVEPLAGGPDDVGPHGGSVDREERANE